MSREGAMGEVVNFGQRVLVIDDATRDVVARVRAFAEREENVYRPTAEEFADSNGARGNPRRPGNRAEHVARLGSYVCTYSITETGELRARHLSVRTPEAPPETAPVPEIVAEIARLFGFTPDPCRWQLSLDACRPACAVVLEPLATRAQGENGSRR